MRIITTILAALVLSSAPGFAAAAPGEKVYTSEPPVVVWQSQVKPKAAILCIHGLGLHRGTYTEFAQEMAKRGVVCYGIDLRGFGVWQKSAPGGSKELPHLDFTASLQDVSTTLEKIKADNPGVPVFLLGESMGGSVALHAAAACPDAAGLISSVPSVDRFNDRTQGTKVAIHALTSGFHSPMDVSNLVITPATAKNELQARWRSDPLSRKDFTPSDLITFQRFMQENFKVAKSIKTMPVLVIQGAHDKLVRPTGTWDVYDHLSTPNAQIVFSKTGEHLIFEYGQFSPDDLKFVSDWIDRQLAARNEKPDAVATKDAHKLSVSYWMELKRDGTVYRCNNKTTFKSGDEIRLHATSTEDGYAYILLESGTSGARAVLFPDKTTGRNNYMIANKDVAMPTKTWLRFDDKPGIERVRFIFSKKPLDETIETNPGRVDVTAFVSADRSGAKDLVPTRMQLSWDDPNPVIMQSNTGIASVLSPNVLTSLVKLTQDNPEQSMGLEIELEHR